MYRWYPALRAVLVGFLFFGVAASLVGTCVGGLIFGGSDCSLGDAAVSLATYGPYLLFAALLLLALFLDARRDHLHHQALQKLSLVRPVEELRPEDFGFQVAEPGERVEPQHRPFYDEYIPRNAVATPLSASNVASYDEDALAEQLRSGIGFALLGPPLSGKSRTLYDVLKRLRSHVVISPLKHGEIPEEHTFPRLVAGQNVVLLLEDINDYVARKFPLQEFARRLDRHAASCTVASTCRDGPEMATIKAAEGTDLGRFYAENIPLKLVLEDLDAGEKERLAHSIGKVWNPAEADMYPTPGSIAMEEPMRAMQHRFVHALSPEQQDTLRALLLLGGAGVLPFTHARVLSVLEHPDLFARTGVHLRDCLEALGNQAFVRRPASQDPIEPEPAYLLGAVSYTEGRTPRGDLPTLVEILDAAADAEGLVSAGYTYSSLINAPEQAVDCFNRALTHSPDYSEALNGKSIAFMNMERYEEALACLRHAVKLRPDDPVLRFNVGIVLSASGEYLEAVRAFDCAIELGFVHEYDAWYRKGVSLDYIGEHDQALEAFDKALELRSDFAEAWYSKGVTYSRQGKSREAVEAYEEAVRLKPDHALAWHNMSRALILIKDYAAALAAAEKATEAAPELASAYYYKGLALTELGRYAEAVAAFDEAMNKGLDPRVGAWHSKGVALERWGYRHEAARWLYRALRAGHLAAVLGNTLADRNCEP